jgi:signal transduction histidine kinase
MQEEIKRLRYHLSEAIEAAEEAAQARTDLLSSVAHEIRTPTASILGYVDLIIDEADSGFSEEQREYLEIIRRNAEHISQLIDDLRNLDEVASGHLILESETVEVSSLVADVRGELYPLAQQKDLTLTTNIANDLPPVRGDESRLRQVLENLVSNALKFTEEGTVTVEATPADEPLHKNADGPAVCIRVIDTGIGIHPDFLPHVFERFSREKRTNHSGSGLGLTIARELVERMGGTIEVDSTLDLGSTFSVRLPAESENPPDA